MTSSEVVWFINHKYGEQAYVVETEKQVLIFTVKSKWIVQKDDKARFGATNVRLAERRRRRIYKQPRWREV